MRDLAIVRSDLACAEPSLPAVVALHLAEAVRVCGGAGAHAQFLSELVIPADELSEPDARLSFEHMSQVIKRALVLSDEPALGLVMGWKLSVNKFGVIGFAALCAATLREALEVAVRFVPLITSICRLRLRVEGAHATLELEEQHPFGDVREFLVSELLVALARIGKALTGRDLHGRLEFAFSEPGYFARFPAQVRARLVFDQPRHRLVFDAAYLDLPVTSRAPGAFRMALALCERRLLELDPSVLLVQRVRDALFEAESGAVRSPAQVARGLGLAPRTLKRKLAERGTSYTELLDSQRRVRALELLRSSASIEEVAARLGYSDAANFTRAFRRWTGRSPRDLRQASRTRVGE